MKSNVVAAGMLGIAMIAGAGILRSGLKELSQSIAAANSASKSFPSSSLPTTRPAEALTLLAGDEPLKEGDVVEVGVEGITAAGVTSTRQCRIGHGGTIRLWYIGDVKAAGLGADKLEVAIVDQFQQKQIMDHAVVTLTARRPA